MKTDRLVLRVDVNYGASQFLYWFSDCAIAGFTAVYLTYRGFSDSIIGYASSISYLIAVVLQLILSGYCDRHPKVPIRKVLCLLMLVTALTCAASHYLNIGMAMGLVLFVISLGVCFSCNGYLNAQMMQFNNVGIPTHYGWTRGMGSLGYAVGAVLFGILTVRYGNGILAALYISGFIVTASCVTMMPNPYRLVPSGIPAPAKRTNYFALYREMLSSNRILVIFLVCVFVQYIGHSMGFSFNIRVIEDMGYGTLEYSRYETIRALSELPAMLLSGYLLVKLNAKNMVVISFFGNGLRYLLNAASHSLGLAYVAAVMNMVWIGFFACASVVLVNRIVREDEVVRGQSLLALTGSLGSVTGYLTSGLLIEHIGARGVMTCGGSLCICAGLMMALFCKVPKERH